MHKQMSRCISHFVSDQTQQGRGRVAEDKYVRQTEIFEHLQLIFRVCQMRLSHG